jgi:mono/diheme cytochrome c family protein
VAGRSVAAAVVVWALAATSGPVAVPAARQPAVTFTRDVAPIVFASCATCHRPDGSAPFSLLSYADVSARADQIVAATSSRVMPPWKPEPGHGEFVGNRRLTDAQIATIRRWRDEGAAEGDRALLPPLPRSSGRWQLGQPDLVLQTPVYTLRASGDDMYRNFVLPIPGSLLRYIRAWEFLPGNPRVVHHATMQFDPTGSSRRLDAQDPEAGYEGLIPHGVQGPDGYFLDWGPGHAPYEAPAGMAWPMPPGTDLLMMLHLRPGGKPETVQATLGLYFSDRPPSLTPTLLRLTRQHLDIPPGEQRYVVTDSFALPADVDVYTVQPHAHNLAREVKGVAQLPDGSERPLIYIRDWDFDWQGVYRYAKPVRLPAGTTLRMEFIYDNSAGNPNNPHRPPRRVTYGQRTTDEMAELWFQVVPRSEGDRPALAAAVRAKVLREEIVGHEKMLEADPGNTALHDGVALLHAETGNVAGVAAHFAETLRVNPGSPAANYNYGMALFILGRRDEAAGAFEKAIALDAAYARAYDGLGQVRQSQGRVEEARMLFERALELDPANADARRHLEELRRNGRE